MSKDLLTVRDLSVRVEEKNILKSLNLSVKPGETHVLMGPNGAGKSTLGNTLMGNPHYEVIGGSVEFQGQNLLDLSVNERAKAGIFMSQKDKDSALIIITHNMGILSSLKVDKTHVIVKGSIVADGDASLVEEINRDGFARFETKE